MAMRPFNPGVAHPRKSVGQTSNLSADILRGAEEIASFIFGDRGKRRRIYHLAQTGKIPVFKLGSTLCARRSTLVSWIESQESRTKA